MNSVWFVYLKEEGKSTKSDTHRQFLNIVVQCMVRYKGMIAKDTLFMFCEKACHDAFVNGPSKTPQTHLELFEWIDSEL